MILLQEPTLHFDDAICVCAATSKKRGSKLKAYSGDRLLWSTSNKSFSFLQIEIESMIVQKQMIPHLKGLVMVILFPEGEGRGVIRGLPRPLFVKSVLFRKTGPGNLLRLPRPCPPRIILSIIWGLKWGIVGLCTACTFWIIWAQSWKFKIFVKLPYKMELFPRLLTLSSIYSKSTSGAKTHNTSF